MPRRDRQRERAARRKRAIESAPAAPMTYDQVRENFQHQAAEDGGVFYERTCSRCGDESLGVMSSWGSMELSEHQRAKAETIVGTHGTYVCRNCDPTANQAWFASLVEELRH